MKINKLTKLSKKFIYLAPGGFTMPYTLGICNYIKDNYCLQKYNYIGASAGSWLSIYLASDMKLSEQLFIDFNDKFSDSNILYKWHNVCPFLIDEFPKYIEDHSFIEEKKIEISVSEYSNKTITNKLINEYSNLNELLNLCMYSSYIPILSGVKILKRNNLINFDAYFSKPDFNNRQIVLCINNKMFDRDFKLLDVVGKNNIDSRELFILGYYDAMNNKNKLDYTFKDFYTF
jgi:hypothetical protein